MDADLGDLFKRTTPRAEPLDVGVIEAAAALRGFDRRRRPSYRILAAVVLVLVSVATGWWGGRQLMQEEMNEMRLVIRGEIVKTLFEAQEILIQSRQEEMKDLALLIRDDYRARISRLQGKVEELAMTVFHQERPR